MKKILEELWYGNISMESNLSNMTSEEKELMEYISRHYDSLQATFNKNQKEIWEKFDDSHTVIRLATSWATSDENLEKLLQLL